MNLYFTREICDCLYLLVTPMALKCAQAKYAKAGRLIPNGNTKN